MQPWDAVQSVQHHDVAFRCLRMACSNRTPHAACTACLHAQGFIFNEMRSKTKCFDAPLTLDPKEYPDWSYDGSSTGQATGSNSDCILR